MTMTSHPPLQVSRPLAVALCAAALMLAGCDKPGTAPAPAAPTASVPANAPAAAAPSAVAPAAPSPTGYTPPSADQLYEMVAPIALYPDKLVAQVLAGATYPEQVTAADQWLAQNGTLKGGPLADAAQQQPWDASVKSLTAFRPVLDQMAKNLPWTTALGEAYYNDPDDVMNAIQVMRQRASKAGKLQSTTRLRVATAVAPPDYTPDPNAPLLYAGPPIIVPPPQFITIEPAQPDVVYVPAYDPQQFYGDPVAIYPGYVYSPPSYATAGALGFGVGVVVGAALERHDWGWHAWGMHWGRPDGARGGSARAQPAFDRPAVVYNRSTYISRSTTVVNNHIRNTVVNGANPQQVRALQVQERQQQAEQLQREQAQQGQRALAQQAMLQQQQQARAQQEQRRQQQAQAPRQQTRQIRAQEAQAQAQQQAQQRRTQQPTQQQAHVLQQQPQRPPHRREDASQRAQAQQLQQNQQQQARQQQQQQRAQAQQARNQQAQAQAQAQTQTRQQQMQAQQQRTQQAQAQRQAQAQARPPRAEQRQPQPQPQPHERGGRPAGPHGPGEHKQNQ
ncbi:Transcription initiation factor TFIID, subunit TAF12 (also component of histone acetyltransferase SAGA) [Variovorax sp. SRS16]|uniref:DUF3300 domain-containing protein n=1 Tax=Variovorax sp. SRS16 TaxID=282217 RepID=UPI001317DD19|nr:DUF3300 domain-containing protein [Variovorax sp. SRS16]VTU13825.1 Transcription initiation factor TFIID, subunit TAF12 (also component of histone acetyltransferase SAGA) [Variovorax sp. SRS16]